MRFQTRLIGRDSIEDARDTMRDIILYHITHKERCEVDTYHRIDQIEPVGTCTVERTRQQRYNLVNDPVE